jgi:pyruvate dehydrogenase E1 component alpha subunit
VEPELSDSELMKMYRAMVLTRSFDIKSMNMQRQGRIGFYVPCAGQEAAQVGSASCAANGDWLFPTYRDVGVAMVRGLDLQEMFAHLMGNSSDAMLGKQMPSHWGYKEINFFSVASPIAAHLPVAVGTATAMKLKKKKDVVLTYFGDGATSEGDFHVACNFAGVNSAPIVFICENNGWAISVPVSRQTASESLAIKAQAYGFDGMRVDGNDVLAVWRATKSAIDKARRGGGPTLIECLTYRMGPHSTSDDPNRYRTKEEFDAWRKRDPIERFKSYLMKRSILNEESDQNLRKEIDESINTAISVEEKVPPPEKLTMFEGVFETELESLKEQSEDASSV